MSTHNIPKRKGTTGKYFTEETQQAVIDYANCTDEIKRNIIFNKYLYKPIKKIVEIYKNKVDTPYAQMYYTDRELKDDCIAHIATNLSGFNKGKGKAFSYISIAARNHFIQINDRCYIQYKHQSKLADEDMGIIDEGYETTEYNNDFRKMYYAFLEYIDENINDLGLSTRTISNVKDIIHFMNNFDGITAYYALHVSNVFLENYSISRNSWVNSRIQLATLWTLWKKDWDGISGPDLTNKSHKKKIKTQTANWIRDNYEKGSQKFGVTGMAKKLGISRESILLFLKEEGL